MNWDTVIAGGTVVSAEGKQRADVAIRGERIVAVAKGLAGQASPATRIIDVAGRYVLPGAIDMHVHLDLAVCNTVTSDNFDSGTRAAARGGVTTIIDFATPYGDDTLHDAFDNWIRKADGVSHIDYGFHMCLTRGERHLRQVPEMVRLGIPTFKQFMIYAREGWQSDDGQIFAALEVMRQVGGTLLVHAESCAVLDLLVARQHHPAAMKRHGVLLHAMTRPSFIEAEAIQRAIKWAEVTGGRLYIVHMSTGEGADLVRHARRRGIDVWSETCPQYLVLDESVFRGKDGHLYATSPQVKTEADGLRLWQGLRRGEVAVVSTDTCSFTRAQKDRWGGDWTKLPNGMPGLETMVPLIYTHGVLTDRLTLRQLVAACCTNPARLMGLYPRKGVIQPGSDADLAVIHPTHKIKVDWRKMETRCDWNPYQGWALAGFAEHTFSRGRQLVENYRFIGQGCGGQYLPREPVAPRLQT